ncbi:MAG: hypothetical protein NV67_03370 [Gammaproteobacteria bacterium (ex Lamellibrachia satsuma)]|nr:MAG: hypothetical protein HPY30_15170 [Gammaproteobacteria bacterium (ex Lamellibrachia satsuma)]RRS35456.1 MAG: hypothetical protein NV67_10270 [Gammaproteobacteria bacterium (ex Lamellibrachia satsuma)]RRS37056.1 MAG: hypothetical protein NV67_03370 [Gammaproteobacteria bacterium (ex Lamellibrachia satsuma)]
MVIQNIAFVASNRNVDLYRNDPAFVYRCENLGLALLEQGHDVHLTHLTKLKWKEGYQAVIFHRPIASVRLWYLLRQLRLRGVVVIADFDDLVFDEACADSSPGVLNRLVSRRVTRRRFRAHRRALSWFDGVIVSTEPLANHVCRLFPSIRVEVIHNSVHLAWRQASHDVLPNAGKRIITYFPGTRSHHRDFAQIREPLSSFLRAHPEVKLQITGPLVFAINADPRQISYEERVPFSEYQARVRNSWVNLAPLEETPFNQCKSALKVLEAGYWGIPTLCSSNSDNVRFSRAGAWVSTKPEEWIDNLERLLNEAEYQRASHELRQRTVALADVEKQAKLFLQFVETLMG